MPPGADKQAQALAQAKELFPGGVNSPVRSFAAVGGNPLFFKKAQGAYLFDLSGKPYLDLVQSWGVHILGHGNKKVVKAIQSQCKLSCSLGSPSIQENKLAELIKDAFPSMEMMRFVSSGTEATMSAIRLARAASNRQLIVKFDGCYHGHVDSLLVKAGSGVLNQVSSASSGIVQDQIQNTVSLPYNDSEALKRFFLEKGTQVAAVIVEPVAANMGLILPVHGFLQCLRGLCTAHGSLLIFDEVITGFRLAWGGAQAVFGIVPDITCLGKIIGAGLPAACYGGSKQLMTLIAPLGPVYQAGTLSGNPLAMAAGYQVLKQLKNPETYQQLAEKSAAFYQKLDRAIDKTRFGLAQCQSLFTIFANPRPVNNLSDALASDSLLFGRFFHALLAKAVYFPPSQFEACFIGNRHSAKALDRLAQSIQKTMELI